MGRQRKRDRIARASGVEVPPRSVTAGSIPVRQDGERPLHDKQWRKAERKRIARLNRLPDPFRSWADRGLPHVIAVNVLQGLVAIALGVGLLRLTTGQWLPPYAAIVVLAVAVALQAACRSVNRRADAKAAG